MENTNESNTILNLPEQEQIQSRIFTVRGMQVMLDRDLADLYQVKTKVLNQSVKRNADRFPKRYMFQLSKKEMGELVTNCDRLQMLKHSSTESFVFTEQGVTQLSAVLNSEVAVQMSIRINDAFHAMRLYFVSNAGLFQRIENVERKQLETDNIIEMVLDRMNALSSSNAEQLLFANGHVFDAWTYLSELVRKAEKRIILIDNYCDERTLSLLSKRGTCVEAIIYTRYSISFETDLKKCNEQYPDTEIRFVQLSHKEHDLFLIVDDVVYIMGDSVKNLGHSLTAILKTNFSVEMVLEGIE